MTKEQWERLEKISDRLSYANVMIERGIWTKDEYELHVAESTDDLADLLRENQPEDKPE